MNNMYQQLYHNAQRKLGILEECLTPQGKERYDILWAFNINDENFHEAARYLKITGKELYAKCKRLNISLGTCK